MADLPRFDSALEKALLSLSGLEYRLSCDRRKRKLL